MSRRLERPDGQLGQQPGGPHPDRPVGELAVLVREVVAQRAGHQDRGVRGQPEQEGDERQRLQVAPLQVVQDQQQRPADGDQRPGQALEEPVPLPGVRHGPRRRRRARRVPRPACRRLTSARQAGSSAAEAAWTAGLRSQSATGASASRPEVPKHWLLATTAPCTPGQRRDLGHQAGLADARAAADQRQAGPARGGRPPRVLERGRARADRPTSCAAARPERAAAALALRAARRRPAPPSAISRWNACRVAGPGITPSSRSSTEAQWW